MQEVLFADFGPTELNDTNAYDLKGKDTFEVKTDWTSKRTGNVGVEYLCNSKDSGILTSCADYYVFLCWDGKQWVGGLCKTDILKTATFLFRRTDRPAGDSFNTRIKLIPTWEYLQTCDKIYVLPVDCFLYED